MYKKVNLNLFRNQKPLKIILSDNDYAGYFVSKSNRKIHEIKLALKILKALELKKSPFLFLKGYF